MDLNYLPRNGCGSLVIPHLIAYSFSCQMSTLTSFAPAAALSIDRAFAGAYGVRARKSSIWRRKAK